MEIEYKTLVASFSKGFLLSAPIFLIPGPHMLLLINETIRKGRRAGVEFIMGAIGAIILMGFIVMLGAHNINSKHFMVSLGFISSIFLLLMGLQGFRQTEHLLYLPDTKRRLIENAVWKGFSISIFNPYSLAWTSTIGLKTLWDLEQLGHGHVAFFGMGFLSALVSIFGTIVYFITKDNLISSFHGKQKVLVKCSSCTLIIFSIIFFVESFRSL